ncbi:MAG: nucleotidyltransferase family protein [Planctomycetota bacterium]
MATSDVSLLFDILNDFPGANYSPERLEPLLTLAGDHGLIALVHDALQKHHAIIPDEWNDIAMDLALNAGVHVKAAAELSAAFQAARVDAVFAKGLALALTVYARPALRPFVDLDVLIEPAALKAADEVLRAHGYERDPKSLSNPIECSYARERLPGFPVQIDLHWSFTGDDGLQAPVRISICDILSRAQTVNGIRVPSAEDTLLLAAANMPRKAAQPLMLVADFAQLARQKLDWSAAADRAQSSHVRTGMWLGFTLASMHLKAPTNPDFMTRLEPSHARRDWLLNALSGQQLWSADKHRQWRYSFTFKLKCLDSSWDEFSALSALPKGLLRKLKLTKTWSQKQFGV